MLVSADGNSLLSLSFLLQGSKELYLRKATTISFRHILEFNLITELFVIESVSV